MSGQNWRVKGGKPPKSFFQNVNSSTFFLPPHSKQVLVIEQINLYLFTFPNSRRQIFSQVTALRFRQRKIIYRKSPLGVTCGNLSKVST